MPIFSMSPNEKFRPVQVFICEIMGTAVMMTFGCLALHANSEYDEYLRPLQGGISSGLLVCTISLSIGYVSGAQCNPCVTLCFVILGKMSLRNTLIYVTAQFVGSLLGMGLAVLLVPEAFYRDYHINEHCGFCTTHPAPDFNEIQIFFLEYWSTFLLVLCVCGASDPRTEDIRDMITLIFAFLISMLVLVIGPFTGTSLNPFRTLASAVFSDCWDAHYLYWFGPLSGSASASLLYKYVLKECRRHRNDGTTETACSTENDVSQ